MASCNAHPHQHGTWHSTMPYGKHPDSNKNTVLLAPFRSNYPSDSYNISREDNDTFNALDLQGYRVIERGGNKTYRARNWGGAVPRNTTQLSQLLPSIDPSIIAKMRDPTRAPPPLAYQTNNSIYGSTPKWAQETHTSNREYFKPLDAKFTASFTAGPYKTFGLMTHVKQHHVLRTRDF